MPFNPKQVQNFIGNGITFPIVLNRGRISVDTGFALIRASIISILSFHVGNRFYLGEFGSQLEDLIEEPNDQVLQNTINTFVADAITKWEKRISTISTTLVSNDPASITLSITYQIVNSNTVDNFIYPFYKEIIY